MIEYINILTSEGFLDPTKVRDARKMLNLTQEMLAEKANVSRPTIAAIEREEPKLRHESTVKLICEALGALPPSEKDEAFKTLLSSINGTWKCHYVTFRDHRKEPSVQTTTWKIESDREVFVTFDDNPAITYSGSFEMEVEGRLVFTLVCNGAYTEKVTYRFDYPIALKLSEMEGTWFGIDRYQRTCTGNSIMKRGNEPYSNEEARELLAAMPSYCAQLTNYSNDIYSAGGWDRQPIDAALKKVRNGDRIHFNSIYYGDDSWLVWRLKDYIRDARKQEKTNIKIRILLLHPKASGSIKNRVLLRPKVSFDNVVAEIKKQAYSFLALKDEYAGVSVEVRFANTWVSGMSCQISDRLITFCPMLATQAAIVAPMLRFNNHKSKSWYLIEQDFRTIWGHKKTKEASKILKSIKDENKNGLSRPQ